MKCKGEEHGGRTVTQFICTECNKVAQRVTTQFFKTREHRRDFIATEVIPRSVNLTLTTILTIFTPMLAQ